jgi:phage gp37-like protein
MPTAPYDVDELEDAVVTALNVLKAAPAQGGLSVRVVKPYADELSTPDLVFEAAKNFPALFVVWGGSRWAAHGSRKLESLSITVIVADRSLRGWSAASRGVSGANPGAYAMLKAVRDLLVGKRLSLEIEPIQIMREEMVKAETDLAVYAAEFATMQRHLYPDAM